MLIRNAKDSAGKAIEVWLRDGKIAAVGLGLLVPEGEEVLDAKGRTVLPAFIDTHCHWRTPGFEYKEDISTGSAAAAAGGYTFANLMPNTKPVCSSAGLAHAVEAEAARVGLCDANQTVSITKDFDGKTFATFGSNESDAVIRRMIQTDGGKGTFDKVTVGTSTFQTLSSKKADFGGFYATWEGVQADMYGPKLNCFTEPDYGVPGNADTIGIITSNKTISSNPTLVRKFVQATKKGYEYAYSHPDDAAAILVKEAPDANLKLDFVKKSMKTIVNGQYWGDPAKIKDGSFTFGTNDTAGAQKYFDFLAEENAYTDSHDKVIHTAPVAKDISTDEFLK